MRFFAHAGKLRRMASPITYDGISQAEVMATVTQPLSLEEFRSRYRQQKPYFEYWFGEPIQKTMPDMVARGATGDHRARLFGVPDINRALK